MTAHLILTRKGYEDVIERLGKPPSLLWVNAGVLSAQELASLRADGVDVTNFATDVARSDEALQTAIRTIREHHPDTALQVERASRRATASRLWHAVLAAIVLAALIAQIVLLLEGGVDVNSGDASRPDVATRFVRFFSFFTVESNLLVLGASIALVVDPDRDGPLFRIVRLDALLGIAITFIVFALVLAKIVHVEGLAAWIDFGFHKASPVIAIVGWLIFGPRPRIDARTIALAFVWPVAWIVYTLVRGALVGWYPYPFLDAATLGYPKVLANVAIVIGLALVLAGAMRWLDATLRR